MFPKLTTREWFAMVLFALGMIMFITGLALTVEKPQASEMGCIPEKSQLGAAPVRPTPKTTLVQI